MTTQWPGKSPGVWANTGIFRTGTGEPALSLKQPWAWLVTAALNPKDVENRTWGTKYRGPLLIHASRSIDHDAFQWLSLVVPDVFRTMPDVLSLKTGGIVGRVQLVDVVRAHQSRWFTGPIGWVMAQPQVLEFLPCRGFPDRGPAAVRSGEDGTPPDTVSGTHDRSTSGVSP